MRHAIPGLIAVLFVASIAVWGSARAEPTCSAVPCTYIPLMRAELLPTVLPTVAPTPQPTKHPTSVYITNYRLDTTFGPFIVGEVENATAKTVYMVIITARLYDASGDLVTTLQGASALNRIDPGQRSPFLVVGYASKPIVRADLTLSYSSTSVRRYTPLMIVSKEIQETPGGVRVVGQVRNNQPELVNEVRVVVTFYLPDGTIFLMLSNNADSYTLAPGAASTYVIDTGRTDLASLAYTVQAEGYFSP
jgi:hypothetical protein